MSNLRTPRFEQTPAKFSMPQARLVESTNFDDYEPQSATKASSRVASSTSLPRNSPGQKSSLVSRLNGSSQLSISSAVTSLLLSHDEIPEIKFTSRFQVGKTYGELHSKRNLSTSTQSSNRKSSNQVPPNEEYWSAVDAKKTKQQPPKARASSRAARAASSNRLNFSFRN